MELGRLGEDLAAAFLQLIGLQLLDRNLRVHHKEIDLLMQDGDCLVFVEVRLRRSNRYGTALESVTQRKARRLRAALHEEVLRRGWRGSYRLDLLTLDIEQGWQRLILEHFRGV